MKKRHKLSRHGSRKMFKRHAGTHSRNLTGHSPIMRGGIRL